MLGTHFKGQAPLGQPSTGNSIPQTARNVNQNSARRHSISITDGSGRLGFGGESYVVAAIATDILAGKSGQTEKAQREKSSASLPFAA